MSGFGVKTPLRKGIVRGNFFFDSARKIYDFCSDLMKDDDHKIYRIIDDVVDDEFEQMQIKGNRKIHMTSYFPDGAIQAKEVSCSCNKCSLGRLVDCENCMTGPKGKVYMKGTDSLSDENSEEDDDESEDDYDDDEEYDEDAELSDMEENELFKHTDYSDTIMVDSFIGIYSHEMANEPFFTCKVLEKKCATENIHDDNNHCVPAGTNYMVCNYLEKYLNISISVQYNTSW